jgi:GT2 family glycosyltransferase
MGPDVLPVSVVIPAYRRPDMVARAIRSVLAQRPRPDEVLVIDDCSGDETGERARALGARVITHEHNQGEGGARNTGLTEATHDWVALLDCDDEWLPDHLATLWAARDGHVLVGTAALGAGEAPGDHRIYGWTGRRPRILRDPAEVLVPENKLPPSAVLLRRDSALDAGGFRRNLPRAADLDMWVRLLERGSALAVPRVTALYHVHPGQVSRDPARMWDAHRRVLDNYAEKPWHTDRVVRRYEGAAAWDTARAAIAAGAPPARTLARLLVALALPQRLLGVGQLLHGRLRGRRRAARIGLGGGATVALLPGVETPDALAGDAVDLRGRSLPAALLRLARRPTAFAVSPGGWVDLVLRLLGIDPVRPR